MGGGQSTKRSASYSETGRVASAAAASGQPVTSSSKSRRSGGSSKKGQQHAENGESTSEYEVKGGDKMSAVMEQKAIEAFVSSHLIEASDNQMLLKICRAMVQERFPKDGTCVCEEDVVEDKLYVVESGTLEITSVSRGPIDQLDAGQLFGEVEVLFGGKRRETVTTTCGGVVLWSMRRVLFMRLVHEARHSDLVWRLSCFDAVPEFAFLSSDKKLELNGLLKTKTYAEGEMLCVSQQISTECMLIESGQVLLDFPDTIKTIGQHGHFLETQPSAPDFYSPKEDFLRLLSIFHLDSVNYNAGAVSNKPPPCSTVLDEGCILGFGAFRAKARSLGGWPWVGGVGGNGGEGGDEEEEAGGGGEGGGGGGGGGKKKKHKKKSKIAAVSASADGGGGGGAEGALTPYTARATGGPVSVSILTIDAFEHIIAHCEDVLRQDGTVLPPDVMEATALSEESNTTGHKLDQFTLGATVDLGFAHLHHMDTKYFENFLVWQGHAFDMGCYARSDYHGPIAKLAAIGQEAAAGEEGEDGHKQHHHKSRHKNKGHHHKEKEEATDNPVIPVFLKIFSKSRIVEKAYLHHFLEEAGVWGHVDGRYCAQLFGVVSTPDELAFCAEYLPGVDLFHLMHEHPEICHRDGKCFPLDLARFYISQLVLALNFMHERGLAFRNLKPESCRLDDQGHLKLIGFGAAKKIPFRNVQDHSDHHIHYRSFTLCGALSYMSPEMVLHEGHDHKVDLWALGILLFELLCGDTPFTTWPEEISKDMFAAIGKTRKDGRVDLSKISSSEEHAKDLVFQLLQPNPSNRLGSHLNHTEFILDHSFFDSMDLDALRLGKVPFPLEKVPLHDEATLQKKLGFPKLEHYGGNPLVFKDF